MLDDESAWVDAFKALKPAKVSAQGVAKLADTLEKLMNKVEPNLPGSTVSPGFFTWNKAAFIGQASALTPTPGPDWAPKLAAAWGAACTAGQVTPGLVNAPSVWAASLVDSTTLPAAAATIPTISAGQAIITAALASIPGMMSSKDSAKKAPETIAKAFRSGVMAFTFVLSGFAGTQASPVPLILPGIPAK